VGGWGQCNTLIFGNCWLPKGNFKRKRKLSLAGKSEATFFCCAPSIDLNLFFQYCLGPTNMAVPRNTPSFEPMPSDPGPTEYLSLTFVTFLFLSFLSCRTMHHDTRNWLCSGYYFLTGSKINIQVPSLLSAFQPCCLVPSCMSLLEGKDTGEILKEELILGCSSSAVFLLAVVT